MISAEMLNDVEPKSGNLENCVGMMDFDLLTY